MTPPLNAIQKAGPFYFCLFFILYASSFGQAIRPISVSESLIRVDDSDSERAGLGFQINFNGINYDSVWVNNNGNLTFSDALSTYTPYLIQQNSQPMFAAFFADVDTRFYGDVTRYGRSTLTVAPGNTRNVLCVNWINVGFFCEGGIASDTMIRNSFQMIIIDRSDIAPGDFDLEYNYDKIKWEAGTASNGNGSGLGGATTASMGWSNGTNTFYSHPGSLTAGAFLDAGPRSLINNRMNSTVNGRYIFSVRNGVVIEDMLLSPGADTNIVGTIDTLVAHVHDDIGNPVAGRKVLFRILSGPHSPRTDSSITDASGNARFIYTGTSTGLDQIVAMMRRTTLDTAFSNHANHLWNPIPNLPPTTNPVTVTGAISATPTITWTYRDPEYNPQSKYEVEVWTGPNGSGTIMWDPAVGTGTAESVLYAGLSLLNNQTYYSRVRAFDGTGWGGWSEVSWIATLDLLPVAEAGPDQSVRASTSCNANVTLNGSGSTDPDGGAIVTYTWNGPGGPWTGATPVVTLPAGKSRITLTVVDDEGSSAADSVFVTVIDSLAPVPAVATLPVIHGSCSVTLSPPTASDNCAGTITATTTDPPIYSSQDTFEITWTYNDGNGNSATQLQRVIVKDTIPPQITTSYDTTIVISALRQFSVVQIDSAKAFDSCSSVSVSAVRSDGLPLDTVFFIGTTVITWKACDMNGNCSSSLQSILINRNRAPMLTIPSDTVMNEGDQITFAVSASDSDGTVPRVSLLNPPTFVQLTDINGSITLVSRPGCTDHGLYTIAVQASDGVDSSVSQFQIQVNDINFPPVFVPIALQKTKEQQPFSLAVRVNDCDGIIPKIRLVNTPSGASFADNLDGHGTFTWTPKGDENGYYVVVFEATDGADPTTKVRDTFMIQVEDVNCSPPTLNVSTSEVNTSVNLPITILTTAFDSLDVVPPLLTTSVLPAGAHFTTDPDNGTGVFTWTPTSPDTLIFVISAIDAFDTTVKVDRYITINVTDNNLTGPVFNLCNDTTIEQNIEMVMKIGATDPDRTIPQLHLINGPSGASVVDNKNGTAEVIWKPACDVSGDFTITVRATDQVFSDTLVINVFVRDVNCAPVIDYISDVSASPGEIIQISVSAFDPDNDSSKPMLSAASDIPGFIFITSANATATFRCQAPMSSGIHPVVFYATDGILTDSMKVTISVGKSGSLKICVNQAGAQIFEMPSGSFRGNYLGHDTITFSSQQGAYWFEVQAAGYRAQRIAFNIKADSVIVQSVTLKPSIPIMVCSPDTLTIGTAGANPESGSFSFVDLDKDQIEDLVITSLNGSVCYNGLDNINKRSYQLQSAGFRNITAGFDPIHHTFADWDNNGAYDCLLSDRSGNIVVIGHNGAIETLVRNPGAKFYPIVIDADKDGKKDLIVNLEGHGLFLYPNSGTDSVPIITSGIECKNALGESFTDFKGVPVLLDLDNDGHEELIILSGGILRVFTIDSAFSILTYKEDLNCAGKRIAADSLSMALIGSSFGTPKLAIRIKDKILIYPTHLLGDVNHDLIVDIQDISKISKQLESLETDPNFTAAHNLKLSDTGSETIDIRDIIRASKFWELQE